MWYYVSIAVVIAFVVIAVLLLRRRKQAKRWINHNTALIPDADGDDGENKLMPVIYDRIRDTQYNAAYNEEHTYAVPTLVFPSAPTRSQNEENTGSRPGDFYNDPRQTLGPSTLELYDDPRGNNYSYDDPRGSNYSYDDPRKTILTD